MKESWQNRLLIADDQTVKRGFDQARRCLFCDAQSASDGAASEHLLSAHGSVLDALLALDKPLTGLTDTQKTLIRQWRDGTSDADLSVERGVSVSTLRNQRFALREREREARLLLAVLSLAGLSVLQKPQKQQKPDKTGDGVEQFYRDGKLVAMPARLSKQQAVMERFLLLFEPGRIYSDREVRELIAPIWGDHAHVRRHLVDTHMLRRTTDGRSYWRDPPEQSQTDSATGEEVSPMPIDKKAAKQAYKTAITPMGIYRLLDTRSGRSVIAADRNLTSVMGRFRFLMGGGGAQPAGPFCDPELYRDYADHPDAFTFEVLEAVEVEKCATYEEAADKLTALSKEARSRYATLPQYIQK